MFKVGDLIRMSQLEVMELRGVGSLTGNEIIDMINKIIEEGSAFFLHSHPTVQREELFGDNMDYTEKDQQQIELDVSEAGDRNVGEISLSDRTLNSLKSAYSTAIGNDSEECRHQKEIIIAEVGGRSIDEIPLRVRAIHGLKHAGVNTVRELLQMTESEIIGLSRLRDVGVGTIYEIIDVIKAILDKGPEYFVSEDTKGSEEWQQQKENAIATVGSRSIDDTPLSVRAIHGLKYAGVNTVGELLQMKESDIIRLKNIGTRTSHEIIDVIEAILDKGPEYFVSEDTKGSEEWQQQKENAIATVGSRSIDDTPLSVRAIHGLKYAGVNTVGELLQMKESDIIRLKNIGTRTSHEIIDVIEAILDKGPDYFAAVADGVQTAGTGGFVQQSGKGFDFSVIDVLTDKFYFKPVHMAGWFGLSRQGIYNVLEKRSPKRSDVWTGKRLTNYEYNIINYLVQKKSFEYNDNRVKCFCINNRWDDLACVFIYAVEIKCFFLKDLPRKLQKLIIVSNYHKYTEGELTGEADGRIVYVIRRPFFLPAYPNKFRANAQLRGMTPYEYSVFISGYPLGNQNSYTDDQIRAFFDENLVDGKVYLSSDHKNNWIRSLASRNGYSIKDFIELYGYESEMDGSELTTDGARERHIEELNKYIVHDNVVYLPTHSRIYRILQSYSYKKETTLNEYLESLGFKRTIKRPDAELDALETDMEVRQSDGTFEEKVFASYPLVGSKIINQETLDRLNDNSRKYIDTVLREPRTKLSLHAKMQIALALINNAKKWKNEENGNFWNYITLQFGYRDASGAVVRLLQNSLESTLKQNHRLFVEDVNGREFKTTAVIHALTTRKSWMALFDFLFDFYKNNLDWKAIPGDPLIGVMVRSLEQRLTGDGSEDTELTISSSVYSFQEGIRKLVLLRPVFTRGLFEKLIAKIDAMVNSKDEPAKTYEEQLCEAWFKEKLTIIANTKRTERHNMRGRRDVAIDYSRIRAKYILKNETDVQIVLPDIRLKNEDVHQAIIKIYLNGLVAHQQNMSWYGNEIGKTLNGLSLSIPEIPYGLETLDIQVRINCDNEEIFNSEDTLYRREWIFYGSNEYRVGQVKKENYTIVLPKVADVETKSVDITEIDGFHNTGLKAFFLELNDGYVVTVGNRLIAFDNENGTDIRLIAPAESIGLPCVTVDDKEYFFAYHGSVCKIILGNADSLQQFILLRNEEIIDFSSLEVSANGLVYTFPLLSDDDTCRLQVINLNDERLVFDRSFILVKKATCDFNREFYYSATDYKDAVCKINIDGFAESISFDAAADEVHIPFRNGDLHIAIPKIIIEETTGEWMNGTSPAWYIEDIPQNSFLKVSNPPKTNVRFIVGGKDIKYDGSGLVTLGNVLQSFSNTDNFSMVDVQMKVSGSRQSRTYTLARVYYKERFLRQPEFWTEDKKLFWNQGGSFIGKDNRSFTLSLYGETDRPLEFSLEENTEYIDIPDNMPIGNYRYEISTISGSLFKKVKEVIAEGDCVVGDRNLLRFKDRRIVVDSITDDMNEDTGYIQIETCYIDHIEFIGMEDTSEGYCAVYSGIMYTIGFDGERYDFSFDKHTNKRGVTKMMVNPVRIVYISDNALCITDSDGDGLYYYHYYDKYLEKIVYALTDHEYTRWNRDVYANADLYSYWTERIHDV